MSKARDIADGIVKAAEIEDGAVTAAKLASGAAVSNIGYTPLNKAGDVLDGTLTVTNGANVYGDVTQAFSGDAYPSSIRRLWEGTFTDSLVRDLFTLNSTELPFAGTLSIIAYKSAEGVAGVWTAACIYPTVTPVVNQQSYVTRGNEFITPSWSVVDYSPTFRVSFGNFSGQTTYTIFLDCVVQQNFSTGEGPL